MDIRSRHLEVVIITLGLSGLVDVCAGEEPYDNEGIHLTYQYGYQAVQSANIKNGGHHIALDAEKVPALGVGFSVNEISTQPLHDTVTLYEAIGPGTLVLPGDWVRSFRTTDMDLTAVQSVKIQTDRKRLSGDLVLMADSEWLVKLNVRQDKKDGTRLTGATIASDMEAVVKNVRTVLLPEPVDQITNRSEVTVGYSQKTYQLQASVSVSQFDNQLKSVSWENPFSEGTEIGTLSTEPDNTYYQASLSGHYMISEKTRFVAAVSSGVMKQDQAYLPYSSIDEINVLLPQSSLDGKVIVNSVSLKLASKPTDKLRLNAGYRFKERENQSERNEYVFYLLDYTPFDIFTNEPYSYKSHQFEVGADYRLRKDLDLKIELAHEEVDRWGSEVSESDENTISARLNYRINPKWGLSLNTEHSRRTGYDYLSHLDPDTVTNPLLRKFDVADRRHQQYGVSVDYMPTSHLTIVASANTATDEYPETEVGLLDGKSVDAALDMSYQFDRNARVHFFYNYSNSTLSQAGSDHYPDPSVDPNWYTDIKDRFYSFGVGLEMLSVKPNLDIGFDYIYSRSRGATLIEDATDSTTVVSQYPDLLTTHRGIQLYGRYRFNKQLVARLAFIRELYESSDWAYDGLELDSLNTLLLMGRKSQRYSDSLIGLVIEYSL